MKNQKVNKKFEIKYFEGYFKGAVGEFSKKDLELSRNWFSAWLSVISTLLNISDGRGVKVLEIGCSIGGMSSLLADRGFEVWASDVSELAVKKASSLDSRVKFSVIDVQKEIPLRQKFDFVIATEVVEHLEFPKEALKNIYSVLKPGGKVIISSPYPYMWNMKDPTHINVKFPHEWMNLLRQVGFQKITYKRFSLLPFFYRFGRRFHIIFPFTIPLPNINSPIIFLGEKP